MTRACFRGKGLLLAGTAWISLLIRWPRTCSCSLSQRPRAVGSRPLRAPDQPSSAMIPPGNRITTSTNCSGTAGRAELVAEASRFGERWEPILMGRRELDRQGPTRLHRGNRYPEPEIPFAPPPKDHSSAAARLGKDDAGSGLNGTYDRTFLLASPSNAAGRGRTGPVAAGRHSEDPLSSDRCAEAVLLRLPGCGGGGITRASVCDRPWRRRQSSASA